MYQSHHSCHHGVHACFCHLLLTYDPPYSEYFALCHARSEAITIVAKTTIDSYHINVPLRPTGRYDSPGTRASRLQTQGADHQLRLNPARSLTFGALVHPTYPHPSSPAKFLAAIVSNTIGAGIRGRTIRMSILVDIVVEVVSDYDNFSDY